MPAIPPQNGIEKAVVAIVRDVSSTLTQLTGA